MNLTYTLCLRFEKVILLWSTRVLEVEDVGLWGSSEVLDLTSVSGWESFSPLSVSENNEVTKLSWALTIV